MSSDDDDFLHIDPETAWLESETVGGFKVWHIIAICLGVLLSLVVMVCCCIRFRIPRTKQEIEADYQRKQITKKFREKLQQIKNSDMDDMDLQKEAEINNYYMCYSDKIAILPQVQHLAWEDHKRTVVSLSIVEAGYVSLRQVTNEVIMHRSGQPDLEHHVVHPTPTYRYKRGSHFMIRHPMVHKTATMCKYTLGPRRYHYIRDQYEDNGSQASQQHTYRKDTAANILKCEHPTYGCNL